MADLDSFSGKIPTALIPQADRPERVIAVVDFIARQGRRPREGEIDDDTSDRHLDYACHAAEVLGFIDGRNTVTETGCLLLSLDEELRLFRFIFAFEASTVGQAWIRWSGVKELAEVKPESAGQFLDDCAEAAESTDDRRTSTLRSWAGKFAKLRAQYSGAQLSLNWSLLPRPSVIPADAQNVFEEYGSDRVLRQLALGTHDLRVASGFFTISGYLRLVEPLSRTAVRLLIGEDDRNPFARRSEKDAAEILFLFRASLSQGVLDSLRRQQTRRLHSDLLRTLVKIRNYEPRKRTHFHAKVYLFDRRAAYVTSANLTVKGLQQNVEAGRVLAGQHERQDIEYFVKRFDELFADATPISSQIVRILEESWAFKQPITPYLLFLKVMYELFERLPRLEAEIRKPLADFQRRIVTPVIRKLLSRRGVMLVSPVGTGKTLMASYIAAYLQQEQHIRRIVVVCPNDQIAKKWRDEMNVFDLTFDAVSHGILRRDAKDLSAENSQLLQQLRVPRNDRLIIVDECHHFRNDDTQGWNGLQSLLTPEGTTPETKPLALLLTATPLSIGEDNLSAMLKLIGEQGVDSVEEINDRHAVVNVTLPFILTHYGLPRPGKRGRALRFGETYRYYPELKITTERYESAMGEVLVAIEGLNLEFVVGEDAVLATIAAGDESPSLPRPARYGALHRMILARRAESSPAAIQESIQRLQSAIEAGTVVPANPVLLTPQLNALQARIIRPAEDTKLQHLRHILTKMGRPRKVLIFSEAVATVEYLAAELGRAFKRDCVRSLTGQTGDAERHSILNSFPDVIDILVSSNASSEGVDLPGARLVVNYDLCWTPLTLAQRIGRIDRPTHDLRSVQIRNFYPGSTDFDRMVGLWPRLDGRARTLNTLTTVQVLGEHERRSAASQPDEVGLVRALYEQENYDYLVQGGLKTPAYMEAWLAADAASLRAVARLPDGVQSGQRGTVDGCYVLVRHGDLNFALFRDRQSGCLTAAPKNVDHEDLVKQYVFAHAESPCEPPPAYFDDEVAAAVQEWTTDSGIDPQEVTIVVSKYLTSA